MDLLTACEATGVRGLLTCVLSIFDTSCARQLSQDVVRLNAAALGYELTDEVWMALCKRLGTVGGNGTNLDLHMTSDHFSNKYDTVLEGILRQMMRGLAQQQQRLSELEDQLEVLTMQRLSGLEERFDALTGGAERDRKRRLEAVARRWKHGLLALAFDGWLKLATSQRALRDRCVRQWAATLLSSAWRRWRDMVAEVLSQRQLLAVALGRMRHRLTAASFARWTSLVDAARERWAVAGRALLRMQQLTLSRCLLTWQAGVERAKEQRALAAACLSRMLHRLEARAFQAWV